MGRDVGIISIMHNMFARVLAPGETLQDITNAQLAMFSNTLNGVARDEPAVELDLLRWLRDSFAEANIWSLYGPEHPFAVDPSLIRSFWDYEAGLLGLVINLLPSITARRAFIGRERVVSALVNLNSRWQP